MTSVERNKAIARRVLEELVSQGHVEVVDEIYAQEIELREPTSGRTITTREGVKDLTRELRHHSPDLQVTIDEEIAEGDAVVHRWTARGRAPNGQHLATPGISIYHFRDGRIVSEFVIPDGSQPA